jgi:hypothetical protein
MVLLPLVKFVLLLLVFMLLLNPLGAAHDSSLTFS